MAQDIVIEINRKLGDEFIAAAVCGQRSRRDGGVLYENLEIIHHSKDTKNDEKIVFDVFVDKTGLNTFQEYNTNGSKDVKIAKQSQHHMDTVNAILKACRSNALEIVPKYSIEEKSIELFALILRNNSARSESIWEYAKKLRLGSYIEMLMEIPKPQEIDETKLEAFIPADMPDMKIKNNQKIVSKILTEYELIEDKIEVMGLVDIVDDDGKRHTGKRNIFSSEDRVFYNISDVSIDIIGTGLKNQFARNKNDH